MTISPNATSRYTEATRHAIVQAAAELLLERKGDSFSVQEVAKRAGLTHRTIYRHFPTRMDLLAATARQLAPGSADERYEDVSTIEGWIEAVTRHFPKAETDFEVVRSVIVAGLATAEPAGPGKPIQDRDAHRWEVFRREFPHLGEADARGTFATLRHLLSTTSYLLYRIRFGLSSAQATRAIQSAARQIAEQARRQDRAAARIRKSR
jgi:AcrR family transcriptional regulator